MTSGFRIRVGGKNGEIPEDTAGSIYTFNDHIHYTHTQVSISKCTIKLPFLATSVDTFIPVLDVQNYVICVIFRVGEYMRCLSRFYTRGSGILKCVCVRHVSDEHTLLHIVSCCIEQ